MFFGPDNKVSLRKRAYIFVLVALLIGFQSTAIGQGCGSCSEGGGGHEGLDGEEASQILNSMAFALIGVVGGAAAAIAAQEDSDAQKHSAQLRYNASVQQSELLAESTRYSTEKQVQLAREAAQSQKESLLSQQRFVAEQQARQIAALESESLRQFEYREQLRQDEIAREERLAIQAEQAARRQAQTQVVIASLQGGNVGVGALPSVNSGSRLESTALPAPDTSANVFVPTQSSAQPFSINGNTVVGFKNRVGVVTPTGRSHAFQNSNSSVKPKSAKGSGRLLASLRSAVSTETTSAKLGVKVEEQQESLNPQDQTIARGLASLEERPTEGLVSPVLASNPIPQGSMRGFRNRIKKASGSDLQVFTRRATYLSHSQSGSVPHVAGLGVQPTVVRSKGQSH